MTGQAVLRTAPCALVMAGGTGGHIFPGLAVAQALRAQGWQVHWLGAPASMESRLVPPRGFAFEAIHFSGVRGKGLVTLALLPVRLLRACWQSLQVLARVRPDVVLGFGGYISLPGGLMAWLRRTPLVLHEQNSIAGAANKVLARLAHRAFCAFPRALAGAQHVGNPLRAEFLQQALPAQRFAGRSGPLQILVLGGSLGAQALNERKVTASVGFRRRHVEASRNRNGTPPPSRGAILQRPKRKQGGRKSLHAGAASPRLSSTSSTPGRSTSPPSPCRA